jgi:hypothetical protein
MMKDAEKSAFLKKSDFLMFEIILTITEIFLFCHISFNQKIILFCYL